LIYVLDNSKLLKMTEKLASARQELNLTVVKVHMFNIHKQYITYLTVSQW